MDNWKASDWGFRMAYEISDGAIYEIDFKNETDMAAWLVRETRIEPVRIIRVRSIFASEIRE